MQDFKKIINIPLVKDSLRLSISNIILFLLPFIVTPILSRIYNPESYGNWGIFSSLYMIISYILFLSYDNAIIKCNEEKDIPNLCTLCFIVSIIIILFLICTYSIYIIYYDIPLLDCYSFKLLIVSLIATSFANIGISLTNRYKKYSIMSIANIINGASQAGFRLLFGFLGLISCGLILGTVFANIIYSIFILWELITIIRLWNLKIISVTKIRQLALKYKNFPLYDAPSNLLNFSAGQLVIIILAINFTKSEIGCYSMIVQFVLLPISFVGSAISKVYYRQISENEQNPLIISKITLQVCKITSYLSILPCLFLVLGGDKLLTLFLGNKWNTAGNISLCLAIISIPVILTEALLPIYKALNKQNERFKYDILIFIVSLGLTIILSSKTKNLYLSIIAYALSTCIFRFMMFYNMMKIAKIGFNQINKYYIYTITICYILLLTRIFFIF